MKQSTSTSAFIHNVKRAFYAIQIFVLVVALPVLSSIEINRGAENKKDEKRIETKKVTQSTGKDMAFVPILPTVTFRSK